MNAGWLVVAEQPIRRLLPCVGHLPSLQAVCKAVELGRAEQHLLGCSQ